MTCILDPDKNTSFAGTTLFSRDKTCSPPVGVYYPPKHDDSNKMLNVVIWLHGYYVSNIQSLFHNDEAQVREQIRDSSKDVVLIAPFLGDRHCKEKGCPVDPEKHRVLFEGAFGAGNLGKGTGLGDLLDDVLKALANQINSASPPTSDNKDSAPPPTLGIKNLVIACHSGGGGVMRDVVDSLGSTYQPKLKECWGFDCLNDGGDAIFWANRMLDPKKTPFPLHISFGPSTTSQSVWLDLISQGKATIDGDEAPDPGHPIPSIEVTLAGQTVKDNSVYDPPPNSKTKGKPAKKSTKKRPAEFVGEAANNLLNNYIFPHNAKTSLHYWIAQNYFAQRLKDASFF
jgi:hypothetical protein